MMKILIYQSSEKLSISLLDNDDQDVTLRWYQVIVTVQMMFQLHSFSVQDILIVRDKIIIVHLLSLSFTFNINQEREKFSSN